MEKRCTQCGEMKPVAQFSVSRQGAHGPVYRSNCKVCASTRAKQWFRDNPERTAASKRRWNLWKNYGVTVEEYEALLAAQNGVCAICGNGQQARPTVGAVQRSRLSVDHCHDSDRVRGLLCDTCNRAIGLLGDRVDLLRKAIDYLERE